jgi:hypothetical protein
MQDSWSREVRGRPVARSSVPHIALAALWYALLLPASAPANPAAALTPDEIAAYARLPVCTLSADGLRLAQQPCRTAPARVPMARRRVPQIMDPPISTRTAVPAAAPAAFAVPASGALPLPAAPVYLPAPPASPPQALSNCSASGCYDAQGRRLDNAAPGVVITPQGKVCSRNGVWIQC